MVGYILNERRPFVSALSVGQLAILSFFNLWMQILEEFEQGFLFRLFNVLLCLHTAETFQMRHVNISIFFLNILVGMDITRAKVMQKLA